MQKPGDVFEVDGVWYVVVDQGSKLPDRPEKVSPQPGGVSEEYIHPDGAVHVCANLQCPNLVPRSRNTGIPRIYCGRKCAKLVLGRKHDAKRDGGRHDQRDSQGRLYQIALKKAARIGRAKEVYTQHLDGFLERCPEANEASNFHCPGRFNPNCYSQTTWTRYHEGGPWPGACLIYAVLKDHYKTMYYAERAQNTERVYTVLRGGCYRWREEENMLPLPDGILRK